MEVIIISIVIILQLKGLYEGWIISGWKSLLDIMICSKCLTFIFVLIFTQSLFLASVASLSAFLLEKLYMRI